TKYLNKTNLLNISQPEQPPSSLLVSSSSLNHLNTTPSVSISRQTTNKKKNKSYIKSSIKLYLSNLSNTFKNKVSGPSLVNNSNNTDLVPDLDPESTSLNLIGNVNKYKA